MAVFDEMRPYLAVAGAVGLLSAPAEVLVPVARRLLGRTGVATGPALVVLVNEALALGGLHVLLRRPDRWAALEHRRVLPRHLAVPLYVLLSPLLATGWERAVVLRGRSALWGVVSPSGVVHIGLMGVTVARVRRARRTPTADVRDAR